MNRTYIFFVILFITACNSDTHKEYYNTGELKLEYQVEGDQKNGYYKSYYKNGNLEVDANYENNKLDGLKRKYFQSGQVDWEAFYLKDKENGIYKKFSEDGILLSECNFENGIQHGKSKFYFPNGILQREIEFNNGKEYGEFISYFNDGHVELKAVRNNNQTVYYNRYNKEGSVIDSMRLITIMPEVDTINIGEEFRADIKIWGPNPEIFTVKATVLDRLAYNNDSIPFINIVNGEAEYSFSPVNSGEYILSVYFYIQNSGYWTIRTSKIIVLE